VIGLAANNWWDLPYALVGQCARVAAGMTRGYWEHSAPMAWPPPTTYREIKRIAHDILPGVQYRRHFYGRYSLSLDETRWRSAPVACKARSCLFSELLTQIGVVFAQALAPVVSAIWKF